MWYFTALFAAALVAFVTYVAKWDYGIAQLLLEYAKVVFTWPVAVGIIVFYFLQSQRVVVSDVLARITKLAFPGGEVSLDPHYPPRLEADTIVPPRQAPAMDATQTASELEVEFTKFLLSSFSRNKFFIESLIGEIWNKLMQGAFGLSTDAARAETIVDKVRAMRSILRMPNSALSDLERIESFGENDYPPRAELLDLHNKAEALLILFLTALASRR